MEAYEKSKRLTRENNNAFRKLITKFKRSKKVADLINVFEFTRTFEVDDLRFFHRTNIEFVRHNAIKIIGDVSTPPMEGNNALKLYKKTLYFSAKYDFDSFMLYMEINRPSIKQFWLNRRSLLMPICKDLQDLNDGELDLLSISLPPRVGKTTLGLFFVVWQMGKYPDMANICTAYGDKLTKSFYERCAIMIEDPTYTYKEIFPKAIISGRNAMDETLDLAKVHDYKTLTCRSLDGSLTGATEANRMLYCDDLVSGIEEALNIERLDVKWAKYGNVAKDRKKDNAFELHIGTRWSLHDPIGRLETIYADNPRYRFRRIPALNEHNESNFIYPNGSGFSTAYYLDQQKTTDDITFNAKYMQEPLEREGLLFNKGEMRYFNGVLDGKEYKRASVIDIAWGGGDFLAMPIAYFYEKGMYIVDVVFNKGDKTVTKPIVKGKILKHKIQDVDGEANNGGDEYCDDLTKDLKREGFSCRITSTKAPTAKSKISRIIQYSSNIIQDMVFLDKQYRSKEYQAFMDNLFTFNQMGKNRNDDAPDSLAMLAAYNLRNRGGYAKVLPPVYRIL